MSLLVALLVLWSLLVLALGINYAINIRNTMVWVKNGQKEFKSSRHSSENFPTFLILIPMLKEQSVVEDTIEYFSRIKYPKRKLKVVIITTSKEHKIRGEDRKRLDAFISDCYRPDENKIKIKYAGLFPSSILHDLLKRKSSMKTEEFARTVYTTFDKLPSTYAMAKQAIKKIESERGIKMFSLVNYPREHGKRSDQLNWFIKRFAAGFDGNWKDVYVGVYDADSRPDRNTLDFLAHDSCMSFASGGTRPEAYQQPTIYTKNMGCGISLLSNGNAIFQTMVSFGYEIPNMIGQFSLSTSKNANILNRRSFYCNGHGEFFRLDVLKRINYFPTFSPADGITIGYLLSLLGTPIKSLPFFDLSEVPAGTAQMVKQHTMWFAGSFQMISCINHMKRLKAKVGLTQLCVALERYFRDFRWAFGPLVTALIIFSAISGLVLQYNTPTLLGLVFLLFALAFYSYVPAHLFLRRMNTIAGFYDGIKLHRHLSSSTKIKIFLLAPLIISLKSIGPLSFFLKNIKASVLKQEITYTKTER